MSELGFDPRARFAGVSADKNLHVAARALSRRSLGEGGPHEGRAQPTHGRRVEWIAAGGATDTVGSEQRVICHG